MMDLTSLYKSEGVEIAITFNSFVREPTFADVSLSSFEAKLTKIRCLNILAPTFADDLSSTISSSP